MMIFKQFVYILILLGMLYSVLGFGGILFLIVSALFYGVISVCEDSNPDMFYFSLFCNRKRVKKYFRF